jgi:hypothetical protein
LHTLSSDENSIHFANVPKSDFILFYAMYDPESSSLDVVDCENIPGIGHVVFVIIQVLGF